MLTSLCARATTFQAANVFTIPDHPHVSVNVESARLNRMPAPAVVHHVLQIMDDLLCKSTYLCPDPSKFSSEVPFRCSNGSTTSLMPFVQYPNHHTPYFQLDVQGRVPTNSTFQLSQHSNSDETHTAKVVTRLHNLASNIVSKHAQPALCTKVDLLLYCISSRRHSGPTILKGFRTVYTDFRNIHARKGK